MREFLKQLRMQETSGGQGARYYEIHEYAAARGNHGQYARSGGKYVNGLEQSVRSWARCTKHYKQMQ